MPGQSLDSGLRNLKSDKNILDMIACILKEGIVDVYVEHDPCTLIDEPKLLESVPLLIWSVDEGHDMVGFECARDGTQEHGQKGAKDCTKEPVKEHGQEDVIGCVEKGVKDHIGVDDFDLSYK